jgi:hypothetical protein
MEQSLLPNPEEYSIARLSDAYSSGDFVPVGDGRFSIQMSQLDKVGYHRTNKLEETNSTLIVDTDAGMYLALHVDDCDQALQEMPDGINVALKGGLYVLCGANFERHIVNEGEKLTIVPFSIEP